jgi:hypothetical protein
VSQQQTRDHYHVLITDGRSPLQTVSTSIHLVICTGSAPHERLLVPVVATAASQTSMAIPPMSPPPKRLMMCLRISPMFDAMLVTHRTNFRLDAFECGRHREARIAYNSHHPKSRAVLPQGKNQPGRVQTVPTLFKTTRTFESSTDERANTRYKRLWKSPSPSERIHQEAKQSGRKASPTNQTKLNQAKPYGVEAPSLWKPPPA